MSLLMLALYLGIGFCMALLGCCFRRRYVPGAMLGGTIFGGLGALTAGILFGQTFGPMIAGLPLLPCLIGGGVAITCFELMAKKLFAKQTGVTIIPFPTKKHSAEKKEVA